MNIDPTGKLRPNSRRFDLEQVPVTFTGPIRRGHSSKTAHQRWCACLEALTGATSPSIRHQPGMSANAQHFDEADLRFLHSEAAAGILWGIPTRLPSQSRHDMLGPEKQRRSAHGRQG